MRHFVLKYDVVVLIPTKKANYSSLFLKIPCTWVVQICPCYLTGSKRRGVWLRQTGIGEHGDFLEMKSWNKIIWLNRKDSTIACMHTHANLYLEIWFTARKNRDLIITPYKMPHFPVLHRSIWENRCFCSLWYCKFCTHYSSQSLKKSRIPRFCSKYVWKVTQNFPTHHILNAMVKFHWCCSVYIGSYKVIVHVP